MKRMTLSLLMSSLLLSACTLMPHYQRPQLPVPDRWPADTNLTNDRAGVAPSPAANSQDVTVRSADQIGWQDFFTDARLSRLVEIALENNRNLRIAMLNVSASQAQFRVQRGNLFPAISATVSEVAEKLSASGGIPLGPGGSSSGGPPASTSVTLHSYSAGVGFTNYELDLFGRQRSLTTQAFEQYLAQGETRRSTQISLVAEVAADYFAVLADQALVKLTEDTLHSETESYELTRAMYESDTTTLLALRQAESSVDSARASLAQYRRQLALDMHALTLVLGQDMPADLPPGKDLDTEGLVAGVPAGLPSDLLAQRPDILSAEHSLRAANANIGAARAAFFPSVELTASGGTTSSTLNGLFKSGSGTWSFTPTITLPIFTGGQNLANLDLAHIETNVAVAQYELTIQTAFREVADALSARGTYLDQREAQSALVDADAEAYRLSLMRFRAGTDSYLSTLDAQRSLFSAQQELVQIRQAELTNEVTLYKALGGGWRQRTAKGG